MRTASCRFIVLVVLSLLIAAPTQAKRKGEAARAYDEGERLYKETDYEGAIKAFTRSHSLHPHYLITCNIARCHERLSDMVKAAESYRRCLTEGGGASGQAAAIRKAMESVETQIAWIRITTSGGHGTAYVDGKRFGATPKRVALNPGTHRIEVRRKGAQPAVATIEADIGEKRTVELTPKAKAATAATVDPTQEEESGEGDEGDGDGDGDGQTGDGTEEDEPRGLSQLWFWSAAAVTVGLAIVGTVFGVQTLEANDAYNEEPTEAGYNDVIDKRLLTNVFLGLALGVAATSTVLFFYTDFSGGKQSADLGGPQQGMTLGLGLAGRF
jgi:PEGA domain